jgi:MSHA biogenesis protein MshN
MSLINKMLQDLDARGSQGGSALPSDVRAAGASQRRMPVRQIAIGSAVTVLALAAALMFWLKKPGPIGAPAVVVVAPAPVPAAVVPVAPVVAAVVQPAPVVAAAAQPTPLPPAALVSAAPTAPLEQPRSMPTSAQPTDAPVKVAAGQPVAMRAAGEVAAPRVRAKELAPITGAADVPAPVAARPVAPPAPLAGGRDMTPAQRSESFYRSAMDALEEGRVAAALDGLEQALKLNPRHDAARQSLVALLIEAGRSDDAMRQLEQGLAVDPAQPTLAMLLARMQIERGASGVATLLRTLPSATGNADYHAFLAGALQRESRHREAAEQYGAALRQNPEQGVWLMGLGISLQADKREREALAAFQRAKASGMLTAPLMAFVERKIGQLAP